MWQAVHEELRGYDFTVITVAEDRSADDAREWIEKAQPSHPALIDTQHIVADRYNMVNVPTVIWIDEDGRIARPNDVTFGSDMFKALNKIDPEVHKTKLRAWVRGEAPAMSPDEIRRLQRMPSADAQLARAEFALGNWLYQQGRTDAATRHFERGGELAPEDFIIRLGTMPMRGINSMGPEFFAMYQAWERAGNKYYHPLPE